MPVTLPERGSLVGVGTASSQGGLRLAGGDPDGQVRGSRRLSGAAVTRRGEKPTGGAAGPCAS